MNSYLEVLNNFFSNKITSREFESYILNQIEICDDGTLALSASGMDLNINSNQKLIIKTENILKLFDTILIDNLNPLVLVSIGFVIVTFDSDFPIHLKTSEDFRTKNVIYELYADSIEEIEVNKSNVIAWRNYILTGKYEVNWNYSKF